MCGIVGLCGSDGGETLSRMNAVLMHRGPDDAGVYHDPAAAVALAMRRLSIVDLVGGHQPMGNGDGTLWVVHNGEIYNAPDIRSRLVARGYEFRTSHADTEVLLHLYDERGADMLSELNGMFAFVIYDRVRHRLFGARDRFGIKPLYYVERPEGFAFASELKALLLLPGVERQIDPVSLFHYLSLVYVPAESSIVRGVKRLPPAHCFTYDLRTRALRIRSYWDLDLHRMERRSEAEWTAVVQTGLREAVRRWILSDVPVGCSLSGGIDSSTIVGLLGEMGVKVKTYSLGFVGSEEQAWNELPLARRVAEQWGTEHEELLLEPDDLLRDLIRMVWHLDEPYGGGLPSWYVFQFMRQDVTVALTGTGGDEVFGNYGKFRTLERNVAARFRSWLKPTARPLDPYFDNWYYCSDAIKRDAVLLAAEREGLPDTAILLDGLYRASRADNVRDGIAYVDVKTQLVDEFLLMTDRFSMAHSLEARVPFLDHVFVEQVFRIPASVRMRADDPKYLLKRAMAHLLPPELLRAPKRGFVIPVGLWLRHRLRPLAESLLAPERLARQGIFRPQFYHRFVQPHLGERRDYTWQVWAALMFQLWHLVFIEEKVAETPSFSWRDVC